MILSGQSIRLRKIFEPFSERTTAGGMTFGLGPAGYDVRVAQSLTIPRHGWTLASTLEKITMPDDLLATVHDKSTWARLGLAVQTTVIEPGWTGYLTLELSNHGAGLLNLEMGQPIAQIIFHQLDRPAEAPYNGKYQDQPDHPQPAILE